jgi:hypothetical protein
MRLVKADENHASFAILLIHFVLPSLYISLQLTTNRMIINYQKIYEQLGYLFYAIASADRHSRNKEFEILKQDIEKEWIPHENSTDEFGTDAANYIYFTFDNLLDREYDPNDAFESFKEYFEMHSDAFDDKLRKRINKTVAHMANAFVHKNKTETHILKELHKLLQTKKHAL